MIEAKNLVRRYGDFAAVDDVSFTIGHGEVVGLLGHNGAGKTTIMKILTGFIEPSAGAVTVNGTQVQADPLAVQTQIGYLPENLPLYPELTVCEYLSYAAQLRGLKESEAVPAAIAATWLEDKALDPIHTLSRGFKQRVGVAQAILHKPAFLILDEPTNGLDPNQIQHMRSLIQELARDATVILSTHIMQEVNAICDRALILRSGRLVVDEQLEELRKSNALLVQTDAQTDIAALLAGHSDVSQVGRLQGNQWQIVLRPDEAPGGGGSDEQVAGIARALIEAGAPVYALTPQVQDLETIFRQVSEQGVADAA